MGREVIIEKTNQEIQVQEISETTKGSYELGKCNSGETEGYEDSEVFQGKTYIKKNKIPSLEPVHNFPAACHFQVLSASGTIALTVPC